MTSLEASTSAKRDGNFGSVHVESAVAILEVLRGLASTRGRGRVGWGHLRGGGFESVGAAQLGGIFGSVDNVEKLGPPWKR